LAKIYHYRAELAVIRRRIDNSKDLDMDIDESDDDRTLTRQKRALQFPALSSPQRRIHITTYQLKNRSHPAYRNFTQELYQFLSYQVYGSPDRRGSTEEVNRLEDGGMVRAMQLLDVFSLSVTFRYIRSRLSRSSIAQQAP
jgi:hypothetical protein